MRCARSKGFNETWVRKHAFEPTTVCSIYLPLPHMEVVDHHFFLTSAYGSGRSSFSNNQISFLRTLLLRIRTLRGALPSKLCSSCTSTYTVVTYRTISEVFTCIFVDAMFKRCQFLFGFCTLSSYYCKRYQSPPTSKILRAESKYLLRYAIQHIPLIPYINLYLFVRAFHP